MEKQAVENVREALYNGLLGLKLPIEVKYDDSRIDSLAEAALGMDVSAQIHTVHHVDKQPMPTESFTVDIVALPGCHSDLKILESHIGGPDDWAPIALSGAPTTASFRASLESDEEGHIIYSIVNRWADNYEYRLTEAEDVRRILHVRQSPSSDESG